MLARDAGARATGAPATRRKAFPPLQIAVTYTLDEVMQQIRDNSGHPSD
jgi:hypothetical protein